MPAERWHSGINEFLQSTGETDEELLNIIMSSVFSRSHKSDEASSAAEGGGKNEGQRFPDVLPILPLRGVGQGRENAKEYMKLNPDLAAEIELAVREQAFSGILPMPFGGESDEGGMDDDEL